MGTEHAETLAELINQQRDRNARANTLLRVALGGGYVALMLLGAVMGRAEFEVSLPIAAIYFGLALAVAAAGRARPRLRALVWYAIPLIDAPTLFFGQLKAGHAAVPIKVALYTTSLFALPIIISMMSLRTRNVVLTTAAALLLQSALTLLLGADAADVAACVFALLSAGAAAVIMMRQLEALLMFGAGLVVTERALSHEVRHQVAERSKQLSETLAKVAVMLPAVRLEPGASFDGRYRVVEALGAGGMGAVYEVERLTDGRHLALKVMTGSVTGSHAARFAREAEIGARLKHPNLVEIVDVGISGLSAMMNEVDRLADTAQPEAGLRGQSLTRTGALLGTPLYMPPEAARGGRAMVRPTDVFAFGVVAHELLSGKLPFEVPVVMEAAAGRPMPMAAALGDAVPAPLRALVARCLAEHPDQRPDMSEVARLLASG